MFVIKESKLRKIIRTEYMKMMIESFQDDNPLAQVQDPSLKARSRQVNKHGGAGRFVEPHHDTEMEDDYLASIGQTPGEEDLDLYGVEKPLADPMYDLDERG